MFAYFLSVSICFIILGTIYNALKGFKKINPDSGENLLSWFLIGVASALWVVTIPSLFVVVILYILKLLTDIIAKFILKGFKK